MTDKEHIKDIIKQYADKGKTQYRECCDDNESASLINYWDGYRDCAYNLLRELEDMQEEPKECMYSKDNYIDEDRKVLCEGCNEECRFNKKEKSTSEDLEQAIDTYLSTYFGGEKEKQEWPFLKKMAIYFANWQKSKDAKLIINAKDDGYRLGLATMKQQMIAKAVDGKVLANGMGNPILHLWDKGRHLIDKKVKVIVIKED